MNKKAIITILLALVAMTGLAQKTVVWEKPSAFMEAGSTTLDITKVELKQTETVLHLIVIFRPGLWIRFAKESFLQTPDGKKYSITGGAKTNEKESDLQPDSLFWIPESGMAHLALHFKPVPLDTKEMDFLEGYNDGDFKFWNICDSKNKKEVAIPDEWKNVQYAKDETLPVAKINKGVATIKVKMLGYKPGMNMDFYVGGFQPLGSADRFDKEFPFADDGTLKVEVPLWLAREVTVGVEGMSFPKIVIAPGQETSILMKVTSDHRPFVAFKGYLAKTNMDLVNAYDTFEPNSDDDKTYLKVRECKTSEERLQCLKDIFNQRVADAKAAKYTTAAQDLINMDAERKFGRWLRTFAITYSQYGVSENGTVYRGNEHYSDDVEKNKDLLILSEEDILYTWKYLDEPASPCSAAFWEESILSSGLNPFEKNSYNADLLAIPSALEDENLIKAYLEFMTHEDCKNVIREYLAEKQRIGQQLATQEHIFYQKYDEVAPENILQTILDKYKGKAVLIDIWATWCGPCRAGHKAMAPMKEEMKGQNVQFVYLTSPTSPLKTWQEMLNDIDGDHYYLTEEQYHYILDKYESKGIPTYAIYNTKGEQTYKNIGFPGNDVIRKELEAASK